MEAKFRSRILNSTSIERFTNMFVCTWMHLMMGVIILWVEVLMRAGHKGWHKEIIVHVGRLQANDGWSGTHNWWPLGQKGQGSAPSRPIICPYSPLALACNMRKTLASQEGWNRPSGVGCGKVWGSKIRTALHAHLDCHYMYELNWWAAGEGSLQDCNLNCTSERLTIPVLSPLIDVINHKAVKCIATPTIILVNRNDKIGQMKCQRNR